MMPRARYFLLALFFLILWLTVRLASSVVHEPGHGLAAFVVGGWRDSVAGFGGTAYHSTDLLLATSDYLQASGLAPADWDRAENLKLITALARQFPPLRYGALGGWLAQLAMVAVLLLATGPRFVREGASAFTRLFWGVLILFNPAWLAGLWFLAGLALLTSTDSTVLVEVILGRQPLALGAGLPSPAVGGLALVLGLLAAMAATRSGGDRRRRGGAPLAGHGAHFREQTACAPESLMQWF